MSGPVKYEVSEQCRILHNEELCDTYASPSFVRVVKSRRLIWARHVARMGKTRNLYRILVGKSCDKSPVGRPRRM
jgi:hypothetical protein